MNKGRASVTPDFWWSSCAPDQHPKALLLVTGLRANAALDSNVQALGEGVTCNSFPVM